jgi:Arc/MetJ-type ribon-helix-helix transcriptional regulator
LRIRLRYITARFLQMPEPRISLRNTSEILRWVQQMRDDGLPRSATELVRLAIEEDPEQRPLWLFLIARACEEDNATEFGELVQAFAGQFPNDMAMSQIDAMAQRFARAPGTAVATGTFAAPADWSASALLGRDDSGQRALHALLVRATQSVMGLTPSASIK